MAGPVEGWSPRMEGMAAGMIHRLESQARCHIRSIIAATLISRDISSSRTITTCNNISSNSTINNNNNNINNNNTILDSTVELIVMHQRRL